MSYTIYITFCYVLTYTTLHISLLVTYFPNFIMSLNTILRVIQDEDIALIFAHLF